MRGLVIELQVIYALVLRETKTRFGAHRLGYVWALLEPIIWIATFGAMYYFLGRLAPPGMGVVEFLVTGIVPFLLFRSLATRLTAAVDSNRGLLFYPRVRPLDVVAARAVLEFATHMVVFVLLMGGTALVNGRLTLDQPLEVLAGLALAGGLGASLGLSFCAASVYSNVAERLLGPVLMRPLFWMSGIFYSVEALPSAARNVLLYNPVLHVIDLIRGGVFPGYEARHVNAWYPLGWVLVLSFLGLTMERAARRRLQLT